MADQRRDRRIKRRMPCEMVLRSDWGPVLIAAGIALACGCRSAPPWVDQGALIVHLARAPGPATASVLYLEPESEPRWSPSRGSRG